MEYAIDQKEIDGIDSVLDRYFMSIGVQCACLVDLAGNIITNRGDGDGLIDVYSLAALSAGNFGTVNAMANLINEEEFSLLFYQGKQSNIYFAKVGTDFLLVLIFGKETSLGFLRLKADQACEEIRTIFEG